MRPCEARETARLPGVRWYSGRRRSSPLPTHLSDIHCHSRFSLSQHTEASLAGLDEAAASLRAKIARVDGEILDAVRAQDAPADKAR